MALQSRAAAYHQIGGTQIEQDGPTDFAVVIGPLAGYKAARAVQAANRAGFPRASIHKDDGSTAPPVAAPPPVTAVASAIAAPTPAPATTPSAHAAPAALTAASSSPYVVKPHDTLWSLAQRFYGDPLHWSTISAANHLSNPNLILVNQVLIVPPK